MSESAFGAPGVAPTWTSSAKDFVTTALGPSRVWATLGYGILNEVYWPATGEPQIRDLGFILAGEHRWIELKREMRYTIERPEPAAPLIRVVHAGDDYQFTIEVVPDPIRDVLLVAYALEGPYRPCALLAPHLGGTGTDNSAWVDTHLCAQHGERAAVLAADGPFAHASAGYVGASDGWQDFHHHGRLTYEFASARDGNVALVGELPGSSGTLALGFGDGPAAARTLALASLADGFAAARTRFVAAWQRWSKRLTLPPVPPDLADETSLSAMVLKVHEDQTFAGAIVASLSIPWGNTSDSRGGYHLVWTRDAAESALALLAIGQRQDAQRTAAYLAATQLPDGHWHQNFYPDGEPFWTGVQLDETAFPILLAAKLSEAGEPLARPLVEMVRKAAAYLARVGPMSPQDRWEENPGANPFTLAVVVSALVAAAPFLPELDAAYALALADGWNERIEDWCYVEDSELARRQGVSGYYVRLTPSRRSGRPDRVELHNRAGETVAPTELVGLEFMYLARLGLRRADDPRILSSLKVAEALLRVETPSGPLYHRYNDDGYGEHEDGRPFDGSGVGRCWPLLSGERGHLALLLGEDPLPYLRTMARTAGPGGLLPEQVWDAPAIPERGLYPGKPSGSAMPLVWAHAEFLKLLVARARGAPCERLRVVEARYGGRRPSAATWSWREDAPCDELPAGRALSIEATRKFLLRVGVDGWHDPKDREAVPLGLGVYGVRLEPDALSGVAELNFTRQFDDGWEGEDYRVRVLR